MMTTQHNKKKQWTLLLVRKEKQNFPISVKEKGISYLARKNVSTAIYTNINLDYYYKIYEILKNIMKL